MFKSVKEFDTAVYTILCNIRDEKSDWRIDLSQNDFNEVTRYIHINSLLSGIRNNKINGADSFNFSKNITITREGLVFIEQFSSQT